MGGKAKQAKAGGQAVEVALPADCRLTAMPALRGELLAALEAPQVALNVHAVEKLDTAALQLLSAFRRDAAARGCQVAWQGVGPVLRDAAALLGLGEVLDLPAATPV
jgi:anti-anti-sigma regulatory factor